MIGAQLPQQVQSHLPPVHTHPSWEQTRLHHQEVPDKVKVQVRVKVRGEEVQRRDHPHKKPDHLQKQPPQDNKVKVDAGVDQFRVVTTTIYITSQMKTL